MLSANRWRDCPPGRRSGGKGRPRRCPRSASPLARSGRPTDRSRLRRPTPIRSRQAVIAFRVSALQARQSPFQSRRPAFQNRRSTNRSRQSTIRFRKATIRYRKATIQSHQTTRKFPVPPNAVPVPRRREINPKPLGRRAKSPPRCAKSACFQEFPCYFPVCREIWRQTGSNETDPPTIFQNTRMTNRSSDWTLGAFNPSMAHCQKLAPSLTTGCCGYHQSSRDQWH